MAIELNELSLETMLTRMYRKPNDEINEEPEFMTTKKILERIQLITKRPFTESDLRKAGKVLKARGYNKKIMRFGTSMPCSFWEVVPRNRTYSSIVDFLGNLNEKQYDVLPDGNVLIKLSEATNEQN
jgi:hypothetical protein